MLSTPEDERKDTAALEEAAATIAGRPCHVIVCLHYHYMRGGQLLLLLLCEDYDAAARKKTNTETQTP